MFRALDINSLLGFAAMNRRRAREPKPGSSKLRRARRTPPIGSRSRRRGPHADVRRHGSPRRRFCIRNLLLAAGVIVLAGVTVAQPVLPGGTASADRPQVLQPDPGMPVITTAQHGERRPNIVFVLTDDLSMDLLRYMPAVRELEHRGMTFTNYFVSDSLCCPSRASIFTGNYPHDTGVWTNTPPIGGINAFLARSDQWHTFNFALMHAGYQTAMMGKYLNGYLQSPIVTSAVDKEVPPGWQEWDVAGWGYPEYNYLLNDDGLVHRYGSQPKDYLTSVIAHKGIDFINQSAAAEQPFLLELATFSPHTPYTPAPRDMHMFPGLKAPEPPNFDRIPTGAPRWLADHPKLTERQITQINDAFRKRVQAVQSVNRMIVAIEHTLKADRILRNTYIVFSSDNGLHTGEYRLMPGKLTAFDTDVHVPLVVVGPGVKPGSKSGALAENIDLAKTFAAIGGDNRMRNDGHTLLPLLHGKAPSDWRNAILVEHQGPVTNPADPDAQNRVTGNPPSYEAMRTRQFLYVEYDTGEREFYNLRQDPYELHNVVRKLSPATRAQLHRELRAMHHCHTGAVCWSAQHVTDRP
jgi:arylsulfatase A-like enzyme